MSRGTQGTSCFLRPFAYRAFTFCGGAFQPASTRPWDSVSRPFNPNRPKTVSLGSSPFARRYLGNRVFFLFLRVLRCFSSPRSLYPVYVFNWEYRPITTGGFPHSDIPGSTPACGSPRLFAACCVLHRLSAPRHPPYALCSLTYFDAPFSSVLVRNCFGQMLPVTGILSIPAPSAFSLLLLCSCQGAVSRVMGKHTLSSF